MVIMDLCSERISTFMNMSNTLEQKKMFKLHN